MKKTSAPTTKSRSAAATTSTATPPLGPTTRKTIEVPDAYFYWVKVTAAKRRMKEKDLWAEILREYFTRHPVE